MHNAKAMQVQPIHHTMVFTKVIMAALFPNKFKMSNIPPYNSKGDPTAHVKVFHSLMDFERVSELTKCQAFPMTLTGLAQSWHSKLPFRSIVSFE